MARYVIINEQVSQTINLSSNQTFQKRLLWGEWHHIKKSESESESENSNEHSHLDLNHFRKLNVLRDFYLRR